MLLGLVIFFVEPEITIKLPFNCSAIQCYDGLVYLAPYKGRLIFKIDSAERFVAIPLTANTDYRIYDFKLTPFASYLRITDGIVKFYAISGVMETVFQGEVSAFIITETEELVFFERLSNQLIFLSSEQKIKFKRKLTNLLDMDYADNKIYVLTGKNITVFDNYGNILELIEIPAKLKRIVVDGKDIYLFSPFSKIVYLRKKDWDLYELKEPIIDLAVSKDNIFTINHYGDNLFVYNKFNF